ncbi:MAG TPA: response regulator [Caulobacteraceae bacterium]|nr:response regulator [Caulobacteraceae bacterium]
MERRGLVSVVDDDESVRESLPDFLRSFGHEVLPFASADEFLQCPGSLDWTGCLILDVAMPGMSGPELQLELARRDRTIPIVFITGYLDGAASRQVLRRGAVACLAKPFNEDALLAAVSVALGRR